MQPSWRDKDEILTITMQYGLKEKKTRSTPAIFDWFLLKMTMNGTWNNLAANKITSNIKKIQCYMYIQYCAPSYTCQTKRLATTSLNTIKTFTNVKNILQNDWVGMTWRGMGELWHTRDVLDERETITVESRSTSVVFTVLCWSRQSLFQDDWLESSPAALVPNHSLP